MNKYFDVAGYNERSKMALAHWKLMGVVKSSWKNHYESGQVDQKNQLRWVNVKEFLRNKFCPPGFNQDKLNIFLELSQGDLTMEEYHHGLL